jgi:class 3 adenylate cyclase
MQGRGAAIDLAGLLRSVELDEYEVVFRDNAIDLTALRHLTDDHLRKLGMPLGARIKLLKAISALEQSAAAGPLDASSSGISHANTAERRQVTVMFADLVGSTALSTRVDPEDLREIILAYHKCAAETVQRFDGFLAQFLGDGVLVYFGYPRAHEDDAERAVLAGLKLIEAVASLNTGTALQTRVGIASGLVVVGDLMRSGDAHEHGIIGETPNLAARLQAIAEPNTVVFAEDTRKLLGNLFELQDLGSRELRGIPRQVRIWTALRASSAPSRFEALQISTAKDFQLSSSHIGRTKKQFDELLLTEVLELYDLFKNGFERI